MESFCKVENKFFIFWRFGRIWVLKYFRWMKGFATVAAWVTGGRNYIRGVGSDKLISFLVHKSAKVD